MRCLDLRTGKGAAILHNVIIAGLSPLARQVAIMPRYVNIATGPSRASGTKKNKFFAFVGFIVISS